jgi:hypothetical protein
LSSIRGIRKAWPLLVAAELLETLVADSEMVSHFVEDDAPDLALQTLPVGAVEALERPAVDRDLVRLDSAVSASPSRQRNALLQPELRLPGRRLFFDDDRDIGDDISKFARERGDRLLDLLLEVDLTGPIVDVHGHASRVAARRQMSPGAQAMLLGRPLHLRAGCSSTGGEQ